jgi:hypothetical protein
MSSAEIYPTCQTLPKGERELILPSLACPPTEGLPAYGGMGGNKREGDRKIVSKARTSQSGYRVINLKAVHIFKKSPFSDLIPNTYN